MNTNSNSQPALSAGQIMTYALALFQGGPGANFKALTPQDAGAIFAAAMKLLLARYETKREADASELGERFERPVRASLAIGPGQPSEIMTELLQSFEARGFLRILSACVGTSAKLVFQVPHVPPCSTWRDSQQDRALNGLIRRKLGVTTVIGEAKLDAVEPSLRAWANSLSKREAEHWSKLDNVKKHYAEIQEAGRTIRATWGQALGHLGIRLDALDTSSRFLALPAFDPDDYAPPVVDGDARRTLAALNGNPKLQPGESE